MTIRTPQPLPKGPTFGGALGEGLRGPYAPGPQRPDRTVKTASPPPCTAPPSWRPPKVSKGPRHCTAQTRQKHTQVEESATGRRNSLRQFSLIMCVTSLGGRGDVQLLMVLSLNVQSCMPAPSVSHASCFVQCVLHNLYSALC